MIYFAVFQMVDTRPVILNATGTFARDETRNLRRVYVDTKGNLFALRMRCTGDRLDFAEAEVTKIGGFVLELESESFPDAAACVAALGDALGQVGAAEYAARSVLGSMQA